MPTLSLVLPGRWRLMLHSLRLSLIAIRFYEPCRHGLWEITMWSGC